jgi:tryptophanyl-tRNA synthetase
MRLRKLGTSRRWLTDGLKYDRQFSSSSTTRRVILSGIQPTGTPHIGNYIGAVHRWVQFQKEPANRSTLLYSVVDLHALTATMPTAPEVLRRWRRESIAALLAAGIDPKRSILFYQSAVAAHPELMWILSCRASVGYLSRMTQWKSKLSLASSATMLDDRAKSSLKLGLFSYPVLQAADILVYRATHVPVGDDQRQHLEFARECATNFNSAYGNHLVCPETLSCRFSFLHTTVTMNITRHILRLDAH